MSAPGASRTPVGVTTLNQPRGEVAEPPGETEGGGDGHVVRPITARPRGLSHL
jgi:hypothetical protein